MRSYDVVLIFRTNITKAVQEKLLDSVKKWLGDGKIAKVDDWGKKSFAYPIKKTREGNYLLLDVESEKGIPVDFEKRVLIEEAILRHLVIRRN